MDKVLFIAIDDLRFDCVGWQKNRQELVNFDVLKYLNTPTLDALAEKALCFSQCISTSSYTTASFASILTGLYPPRHGLRAFLRNKLNRDTVTLAEVFRESGYRTVLYTDDPGIFKVLGLSSAFEKVVPSFNGDELFHLLEELRHEKVFLFAHFLDVHEPYMHNFNEFQPGINEDYLDEMEQLYALYQSSDFFDRDGNAFELWNYLLRESPLQGKPIDVMFPLYVKGVSKFDQGRLRFFMEKMQDAGMLERALTVIFSDHGEGRVAGNNVSHFSHAGELYDNAIRVPLMIIHPELAPGVSDALVSTVDIFPTVLALLDIKSEQWFDGLDILSEKREAAYAEQWQWINNVGVGGFQVDPHGEARTVTGRRPIFRLSQMAMRTNSEKFVIKVTTRRTKELRDPEAALSLENEAFVKTLFEEILDRDADPGGLEHHVDRLKQGILTKPDMIEDFYSSQEYESNFLQGANNYVCYDLIADPLENVPLDPSLLPESQSYFDMIKNISSQTVPVEMLFEENQALEDRAEEQALVKSLKDLGYF